MKKITIPVFILLVVLLSGCLSAQEQTEARYWATQNAEYGIVPPPKFQTLAATAFNLRLTSTPQGSPTPNPNWTPTMNFMQYSSTQAAQVQNNAMTAQVQQQEYEMRKLQAEQAAEQARVAEKQHQDQMTAQAHEASVQATAQIIYLQSTANAQSTERAIILNAQSTATSAALTAIVQPTSDMLTLQAARIQQTVEAGEADKVALSVQRQEMKNYFDALLPWTLTLALAYVFGRGFSTWVKTRTHPRDEHGRPQTFTRELPDGGVVMVKPEQLESGIVKVTGTGDVIRYAPMDKQEQSDINRRSQAVEAIAALPSSFAQQGPKLLGTEFGRSTPRVNLNNEPGLRPVLDEADGQFLEGDQDE